MLNVEIKNIILNKISKEKNKESFFIDYIFTSYKKTIFNELEQLNKIEKKKKKISLKIFKKKKKRK